MNLPWELPSPYTSAFCTLSSPIMPLSNLTEHIPAQVQAIRQLSSKVNSGVSSKTT